MIYIYHSDDINLRRLEYVAAHIFRNTLGVDFVLTTDKTSFLAQSAPCINYSPEDLQHGLWIIPQGLLSECGVNPVVDLCLSQWNGLFCFFARKGGDVSFDLFSATFYLLTLYEECFMEKPDEHGRFSHEESLLYRNRVLGVPVVDRWAYRLKAEWERRGVDTSGFTLRKYQYISTFDIDHPYLYRNKSWWRTVGGLVRDALRLQPQAVTKRLSVISGRSDDPYFAALRSIEKLHKELGIPYYLFILMGEQTRYDRHTASPPLEYYAYLRELREVTLGLHPSYNTFRNPDLLRQEKVDLGDALKQSVLISRQHFLRMRVPDTFRELSQIGIEDDYTLTFSQAPGFRAGTAIPFQFYDLPEDRETPLLLHPTAYMDSTFVFNKEESPESALCQMKCLIDEAKVSGGDCVALWHNSNLAGSEKENPWINIFEESIKYGISQENN